jgi:hypothetical protein
VISRKIVDLPKLGEPFGIGQYSHTVAEAATHRYSKTVQASLLP